MDVDVVPIVSAVESYNYMQLDAIKFNYTWTCSNYTSLYDCYDLTSPMFSYGANDEPKFSLIFKLGGEDSEGDYHYGVYLELASSDTKEVEAEFKFAFINANGEKCYEKDSKGTRIFKPGKLQGRTKFIVCDLIDNEPNDFRIDSETFKLFCEVTVYQKSGLFQASKSRLSDDLGHLLDNEEFSDVTLSVNGYDYKVHRNILAARSTVFAAMFKTDMQESRTGKVIITDVDNDVLKEMLRFIYTGRSLSLHKMAEELLVAADKYELETLKGECQNALSSTLSIANAPKMLVLADVIHADQLKARTIDFISTYTSDVMETAAFKTMFNTHPELIAEVFRAVATKSMSKTSTS